MIRQPLFGQDSSPHFTSLILSSIITLICWIIFCVLCFVIKFKPAVPEYKEIQIVLSSTPTEQKVAEEQSTVQESAAAVLEPVSAVPESASAVPEPVEGPAVEETVVEQQPAVPEPVEAQVVKETPKPKTVETKQPVAQTKTTTTTAPKTTDSSKKVNFDDYQYATDYSDFDFNNTATSSSQTKSFDWSQFEDSSSEPAQVSQKVEKVTTASSTSGSAASTSTANQRQTSSSSSSSSAQQSAPAASSSTSAAADAIKNTTGTTSSGGTTSGSGDVQKFSSDLDIAWNGGSARKAKGALSINLTTGSSIKEKKTTVKIEFVVGEDGYVTPGSVKITPEALLPEVVRKEVIAQINLWRFNEAPNRSTAVFEYTIIKKE